MSRPMIIYEESEIYLLSRAKIYELTHVCDEYDAIFYFEYVFQFFFFAQSIGSIKFYRINIKYSLHILGDLAL